MTDAKASAGPEYYLLRFRSGTGDRWKTFGRYPTSAEALAGINSAGDWHIASVFPLTAERATEIAKEFEAAIGYPANPLEV